MISKGEALPDGKVRIKEADSVEQKDLKTLVGPGRAVLFGVPGAFTPTCSNNHLPGYVRMAEQFRAKGVDFIGCVSVNDAHVMQAWGTQQKADGKVAMLADGSAEITRAMGLEIDRTEVGMGMRSKRYAMIVENGKVVKLFVEEPGKFEVSSAEYVLGQL